jgi:sulfur relay (sulfurtransferase) DsrF/TusC family protein
LEKEILIVIKSAPFRNLNYYEGLRTAAGLWDHSVKILWSGKGVFGALNNVDNALTKKFLADLPDIDIEMYVDGGAMEENGFNGDDLVEEAVIANAEKINELIEGAEASLVF